jgi:hypothetical protein
MIRNQQNILEAEIGEVLIWQDRADDDEWVEWVVEYSALERRVDSINWITCYHAIYGLKAAILLARKKVEAIKHSLKGQDESVSYGVFFLIPDNDDYVDITDDAATIQVLFQYDNYK